jgi:hypothetical protein
MAYTLANLQAVEAAIATGATRVEMDGRMVIYQNVKDLIVLRDMMRAELDVATPSSARGKAWKPTVGTGL